MKKEMVSPLTGHTAACMYDQMAYADNIAAYRLLWPNACEHCGGTSEIWYYGGRHEPSGAEPCGSCVDAGVCPRCAGEFADELWEGPEPPVCPHCGWTYGVSWPMPDAPECFCWELLETDDRYLPEGPMTEAEWRHEQMWEESDIAYDAWREDGR